MTLADDDRREAPRRALIADPASRAYVSSISIAELSITSRWERCGFLTPMNSPSWITFYVARFTAAHAEELRSLPWHHRDPFDRMLSTRALTTGASLMPEDEQIRQYAVNTV